MRFPYVRIASTSPGVALRAPPPPSTRGGLHPCGLVARALIVALVVALAGCGFQLRRELALPAAWSTLSVVGTDPFSPLVRNLEQALRRAGANVVEDGTGARLILSEPRLVQRPLSIGGSGRVQEFALVYTVTIELTDTAGAVALPRQTVELERVTRFDTAQALGSPGEEELVRTELERDMVDAILRRIEAATRR